MIIYKITNLINGKIYVGQTKFSVEKRFKEHAKADSLIGRAIRKYGKENFKIEVIETCKTFIELNEREIFWIAKLNCKVPNGYNIADGGSFYAVKKVDKKYYIVKMDETGKIIGYFLLKDKFIDKVNEKRYYIKFDEETGKTIGLFPLKPKNLGKGWIAVYQEVISKIADLNLPNEQYRVFLKLLSKTDFENYLTISQTELSKELGMKQPNIAKAIKGLCEQNIIIEGPRIGLNKSYRLNPYIAHKGSERKQTIVDFEKLLKEKTDKSESDADNDKSE
ncbi:MAG: GIY-YIG nuclease family protein [Selenomonadaceae bacterium]|nr:GIY-YIG nuclease family protein [Selenomonadaceae bacterium]